MKRLALIVLLLCTPALAHDANRPELNSWFDHLASGKGLCCSFADGMALSDVDWESLMVIIASVSITNGSTSPMMLLSPSRTARAGRWFGQ
jgi:hypothetical protein